MGKLENDRLAISTLTGHYFFSPEQIVRMEASSNYTNVFFTDRKPMLVAKQLKEYEDVLHAYGFIRTHRSHLVNSRYILFVDGAGNITMKDSSKAEISRRKKRSIMRTLKSAFSVVLFLIFFCLSAAAQTGNVGIGTATPDSSAMLEISSTNKGLLIPRVALTAANIWSLAGSKQTDGMLIYNTAYAGTGITTVSPGVYYWRGNQWFAVYQSTGVNYNGTDTANCGMAGGVVTPQTAGFMNGQSYTGSISAPYKGGNGGTYPGEAVTIKGITLTRTAGTLAQGNGMLIYTVSGTYTGASGVNLIFPLNLLGGTLCNVSLPLPSATFFAGTLNCNPAGATSGFYQAGLPATAANTRTIRITTSATGSYSVTSTSFSNNGVVFSASGIAVAGVTDIVLTASGTPITSGTFSYLINIGGQSCSFSIYYAPELITGCGSVVQNTPGGTLVNGVPYSGTVVWNYTNGNGTFTIPAQTVGPVNGLTLSRPASTAAAGNGSITYTLSGTYTGPAGGIVSFPISLAGANCSAVYGDNIRNALNAGGCTHCAAYDAAFPNTWVQVDSAEYKQLQIKLVGSFIAGAADMGPSQGILNCQRVGTGASYSTLNARVPASSYIAGFSVANPVCDGFGYNRLNARVKTSTFFNTGYSNYGGYLPNDTIKIIPITPFNGVADHPISYYVNKTPGVTTYAGSTYLAYYDGGGISPFNYNDTENSFNSTQGTGDTNILGTANSYAWFRIQAITTTIKQW